MSLILVTGGTGVLGRAVVRHLLDSGHQVRLASRRPPLAGPRPYAWSTVDYRSGDGLDTALNAADSVIHCAGDFRGEVDRALLTALQAAGGPHLVYISIVGVDRIPLAYYRLKLAAEQAIETSNVPYTILRTTQFHDLIRCMFAAAARLPVMLVPDLSVQPIAVRDVAVRLVELAVRRPSGHARDLGGLRCERSGTWRRYTCGPPGVAVCYCPSGCPARCSTATATAGISRHITPRAASLSRNI